MYHEITTKDRKRKRRNRLLILLGCVAVIAAIALAMRAAAVSAREQGAVALRQAILDAAIRCCAIEGSYPLSLDRLEQNYGLRVNHRDYIITYEAYASNMVPSVVVVPR
ncbi:MAG: hypothetical protein IKF78_12260 [Atopobiaceae bacterium]|nr:hypothetical protein [Atopobiaceae bacterium]